MNEFDALPDFQCEACGACCRYIDNVPELAELFDPQKKSCKYLENNKCVIYENRPDVCNYKKLYKRMEKMYTPDEYYNITVKFCEEFKIKKYDK